MKRPATEEAGEHHEKRTKTSHEHKTSRTKHHAASSQDSLPSSQQSNRETSSETAETDYRERKSTSERTQCAQSVLDLVIVAIEARRAALSEQKRLAALNAQKPLIPWPDAKSVDSSMSTDPTELPYVIALAENRLASIAEAQQARIKHISNLISSDDELEYEAPLKALRLNWFDEVKNYHRMAKTWLQRQNLLAQAQSVLQEHEKAWEDTFRGWSCLANDDNPEREAATVALDQARDEVCKARISVDRGGEAHMRERIIQHAQLYLSIDKIVEEESEARDEDPHHRRSPPPLTEKPIPVLTNELRKESERNLLNANNEVVAARERFDHIRNRYSRQLGNFLAERDNGKVHGSRTEFDQAYYIDRGVANRRVADAEANYTRAKALAQGMGALRTALVTSNFCDHESDGYADEDDPKHWYFQEVDQERIAKWLAELPEGGKEGFAPVYTPVVGLAEASKGRFDGVVKKEIDVVSSRSHNRYAAGPYKKKIDAYQEVQAWRYHEEQNRRAVWMELGQAPLG